MKRKIVLKYARTMEKPYQVIKATNTVDWEIGKRLTKEDVQRILDERPNRTEVEIVQ